MDMPPPSKKRDCQGSVAQSEAKQEHHKEDFNVHDVSRSPEAGRMQLINETSNAHPARRHSAQEASFVHSLCGKAFASRSGVKKHHWGGKSNNHGTTIGCWARHGKPNTSWDEHLSCKEQTMPLWPTKKPSSKALKQEPRYKASIVPAMLSVPRRRTLPKFPTLQHLPQTVAEIVAPTAQPTFQNIGLYHSYGLTTQSRPRDIFIAATVGSKIEAPQAQGRNDSVVCQIDAQAVAAERNRQYVSSWVDDSLAHQEGSLALESPPSTHDGLTLSFPLRFPRGIALLSHMQENNQATSATPSAARSSYTDATQPSEHNYERSRSLASPDPESKKLKL